jgi:cytidyltransferase-like protein
MNKVKVGIISGYFNPVHRGHIEYINAAKEQCDYLICIVNNDDQVALKGSRPFMDEQHRLYIMNNIKSIDKALVSVDIDKSVAETLNQIVNSLSLEKQCEFLFFNSGDRSASNENESEAKVCNEKNIQRVFIQLPKVCSSSELKLNLSTDNVK